MEKAVKWSRGKRHSGLSNPFRDGLIRKGKRVKQSRRIDGRMEITEVDGRSLTSHLKKELLDRMATK